MILSRASRRTFKVFDAVVGPVVFPTFGVVPLDPKPFSCLVCYVADVANSTSFSLQRETFS